MSEPTTDPGASRPRPRNGAHPAGAGSTALRALIGVATSDITPPVGIYNRWWGAAPHDTASSVHRPLLSQAVAIRAVQTSSDGAGDWHLLVICDLCEWMTDVEERGVRQRIAARTGVAAERLLLHSTHTHSAPPPTLAHRDKPGGHLMAAFIEAIAAGAADAAARAISSAEPALLDWASGHAEAATNREQRRDGNWLIGFNPEGDPDDTVLVGRVSREDGTPLATLVNYACHPTTLGVLNDALSPDYVGALRELVEQHTGAPCVFLQGASGDQAPAHQYTDDSGVADRVGRAVGFAVLGVLSAMPPAGTRLAFTGALESGAPLAVWRPVDEPPRTDLAAVTAQVTLPRNDRSRRTWHDLDERTRRERLERQRLVAQIAGGSIELTLPVTVWRLGLAVLVAVPGEAYSWLQVELRARLADRPVVVLNLTNCAAPSYFPPAELYVHDIYSVWQTAAGPGSLELIAGAALQAVADLERIPA